MNKPVAYAMFRNGEYYDAIHPDEQAKTVGEYDIPLYTHPSNPKYDPETGEPLIDGYPLFSGLPPPTAKTLTDEEIKFEAKYFCHSYHSENPERLVLFARAILRKAQEK
jgi:hypothetical protein